MLNIEHFSKTYPGGKRAVDDLSLHVAPGEIFGFIGHNGAGKTTTLRAVAGVMDFSEGNITIDGHEFGTFVIDEADPTKLHITVTNHNGNKYVEGTFKFDLAAGALKDASGNENEELSYTIHFTQNPGV